jgi:8-oxo-dGTP pyrophosphatase MutT (NUDIX family)
MNDAAAADFQHPAAQRLLARLAGTRPNHDPASFRIGAGLPQGFDERLQPLFPSDPRPAAVLIALVERDTGPGILLTVRSSQLRDHAGQIAFPGGRIEAGDAGPAAAALREAQEEIGLEPTQISVLGYLPDHLILTGFRVTPVVARVAPGFDLRLDAAEVQETFELPWQYLLDPRHHRDELRRFAGTQVPVREIVFAEHRIWGATAGMLFCLRDLALS